MEKQAKLSLGIDDSGRGPVIGPMVMAGCLVDEKTEKYFRKIGVRDSKMLAAKRREILAAEIKKKAISFEIIKISPKEIDGRNHVGINLNKLEAIKSAEIINKLIGENNGVVKDSKVKVFIDCPSPNIPAWQRYLMTHIDEDIKENENIEIICSHKADVKYVSCSAASVIAKVTRDAEIEIIKRQIGQDFGSGYTSDPVTCKFLEKYSEKHKKDGIFRQTWQTWKNVCKKKEQKKLGEF